MDWSNVGLVVLGLTAFSSAFVVALWIALVIWTFRDMRARARDAFAQLLAALMVLVLGPLGAILYLVLRPRETLAEKYERSLEEEALLQDIEERNVCPGCKQPIEPDYRLCPICHTRLRRPCIHCGRLIHPRWEVCPYCGESQKPAPGVAEAARVTLLDLEEEIEPLETEAVQPEEETESIEELEAEALRNLDVTDYGVPLVPDWELLEDVVEASDAGELEGTEMADAPEPRLASDEALGLEPSVPGREDVEANAAVDEE